MVDLFLRIVDMSITASAVIAAVLLIRLLLRRAPRKYTYLLWSVVGFRLLCPVSFSAFFSLFAIKPIGRASDAISRTASGGLAPEMELSFASAPDRPLYFPNLISEDMVNTVHVEYPLNVPHEKITPSLSFWPDVAAIIWCIGVAVLLAWAIFSYIRLTRRLRTAVRLENGVWAADTVRSPFILGFLRPRVYVPFGLDDETYRCVILHERCHMRHLDHLIKPFAFALLVIHWFNPLVWFAFNLMGRDMEMRCDEYVLAQKETNRCTYSTTLLSFASNTRFPAPIPLAFGEISVGARIKHVLHWKKPTVWITAAAILLCAVVLLVCAADPIRENQLGLENDTLISAEGRYQTLDGAPFVIHLNAGELQELHDCLLSLELREDDRYALTSVLWRIQVERESGELTVRGFEETDEIEIEWQGKRYVCEDEADAEQIRSICAGLNRMLDQSPGWIAQVYYQVTDILYDAPQYSSTFSPETAPMYYLDSGKHLWEGRIGMDEAISWTDLGKLTDVTLDRVDFDDGFSFEEHGWSDKAYSPEKLRTSCTQAMQTTYHSDQTDRIYYWLRLNDGLDYILYGYQDEDGKPHFRWLFALTQVFSGSYSAVECTYMSPISSSIAIGGGGQRLVFDGQTVEYYTGSNTRRFSVALPLEWKRVDLNKWTDRFLIWTGIPPAATEQSWLEAELTDGFTLINLRDGRLWLVSGEPNVWSIYEYVPTVMGDVVWEFRPMMSAFPTEFGFTIDADFSEAIITATAGTLIDPDTGKQANAAGGCLVLEEGKRFAWRPLNEEGMLLGWCEIHFQLETAPGEYRRGTIRINCAEQGDAGKRTYCADIVSQSFTLVQNEEYGGGIILPVESTAASAEEAQRMLAVKTLAAERAKQTLAAKIAEAKYAQQLLSEKQAAAENAQQMAAEQAAAEKVQRTLAEMAAAEESVRQALAEKQAAEEYLRTISALDKHNG
ncbi:MAG: hypothetical protein IKL84_03025 [Clostridia bacterium]|nr:hypothetical protein [Clostridia bacterium]